MNYFVALLMAFVILFAYALSWIATCGLVKLVTMCFGWTFSWPIATGVWLVMLIIRNLLKR